MPDAAPGRPDPDLRLDVSEIAGAVVVAVGGDLDINTVPQVRRALDAQWDRPGGPILLDLAEVTFFSSAAVRMMVDVQEDATRCGRSLRVVLGHARAVIRALEITGVDRMLERYETDVEALAAPHRNGDQT